jgi:hypothetical protein
VLLDMPQKSPLIGGLFQINALIYIRILVAMGGLEPPTPAL